nr:hypothetical protein [Tanacetum cinerariifolium]
MSYKEPPILSPGVDQQEPIEVCSQRDAGTSSTSDPLVPSQRDAGTSSTSDPLIPRARFFNVKDQQSQLSPITRPQPSSPTHTHVADEAASTRMDIKHGEAATIITSLDAGPSSGNIDKTPSMPHDSPLPRVNTLGKFEDPSNYGRSMIEEIDQDAEVTLVTLTQVSTQGEAHSQEDQPEDKLRVLSVTK